MVQEKNRFLLGVALGFIVIILLAALNVNALGLIPVLGPFFGGIVAGYVGGRNSTTGAQAGIIAGAFGTAVVIIDFILKTDYVQAAIPRIPEFTGVVLFLVAMVVYFPILAFIGGAIGGAVHRATEKKDGR